MVKIKLTHSQESLIRNHSKLLHLEDVVPEYATLFQLPWWFRPIKGTDEWEMVLFEDMPKNIKLKIEEHLKP